MPNTVLIVDDEPDVVDLVRYNVQKAGYNTLVATAGPEALATAHLNRPDIIVLDVMLPGMSGFDICRVLKQDPETAKIPILMLTAKGQQADRITGLEFGAEDYVTKPFSPRELVLRLEALLRRSKAPSAEDILLVEPFAVNRRQMKITMEQEELNLTSIEFKLLALLIERRGKTLTRETLLHDVWGYQNLIDTRTVDTHMRRLREKLGKSAARIETVRGEGYRFKTSPNL